MSRRGTSRAPTDPAEPPAVFCRWRLARGVCRRLSRRLPPPCHTRASWKVRRRTMTAGAWVQSTRPCRETMPMGGARATVEALSPGDANCLRANRISSVSSHLPYRFGRHGACPYGSRVPSAGPSRPEQTPGDGLAAFRARAVRPIAKIALSSCPGCTFWCLQDRRVAVISPPSGHGV